MPTLKIDGRTVEVEQGMTVLDAARKLGISIPTMCFREGFRAETSCMVCVVKLNGRLPLAPACATRVTDSMVVESETDEVRGARRAALDLLLSDHVGDCEAPCRRACPAHMDIPGMIRRIAAGKFREAIVTVKQDIALPAILGRICPAPCEKACRRSSFDGPVSICLLKRFAADQDLASASVWLPTPKPASGEKVAVVGAGPTGLSAAFYLRQQGHACTVFDEHAEPGGMLRYGVPEAKLPRAVLDGEIDLLRRLGVEFRTSIVVGKDISMADVEKSFDAVVLAIGGVEAVGAARFGVTMTERGIQVETSSFQTSRRGCFAGGDAIQPTRLAVRATGHGKAIAAAVSQFLNGEPVKGLRSRFNCRVGRLKNGEMEEYLKEADRSPRQEPHEGGGGFSREEAVREAGRCLHCDCRKADACRLRDHAEAYGATQLRYAADDRRLHESAPPPIESSERVNVRRILDHADVVFEPGKCVRCGLCVQVTEKAGEKLGLTFLGRGFGAQIGIPFNEPLDRALEKAATECIDACPTGALAHRNEEMK